jgi:hypothetical protein
MINMIPHGWRRTVVYRGKIATSVKGAAPGVNALIIDGVEVPHSELDAWYQEKMLFDWRGQPFDLERYQDGRVYGGFKGKSSAWARENGLEGGQHEGWFLNGVPEQEIEKVRVERTDILEHQRYRQTFKVNPPEGMFVTVRPATDQEWIRE